MRLLEGNDIPELSSSLCLNRFHGFIFKDGFGHKEAQVGETRLWKRGRFKKVAPGVWEPLHDSHDVYANPNSDRNRRFVPHFQNDLHEHIVAHRVLGQTGLATPKHEEDYHKNVMDYASKLDADQLHALAGVFMHNYHDADLAHKIRSLAIERHGVKIQGHDPSVEYTSRLGMSTPWEGSEEDIHNEMKGDSPLRVNLGGGKGKTLHHASKRGLFSVFKPEGVSDHDYNMGEFRPHQNPKISPARREVAVHDIDRALDFHVVPPTIWKEDKLDAAHRNGSHISDEKKKQERWQGSSQFWVDGREPDEHSVRTKLRDPANINERESLSRIAVLDYLIGNSDRHYGNFIFHPETRKYYAIDNGSSLPDREKFASLSHPLHHMAEINAPISRDIRNRLDKINPNKLKIILKKHGFSNDEVKGVTERLETARNSDTYRDIYRNLGQTFAPSTEKLNRGPAW